MGGKGSGKRDKGKLLTPEHRLFVEGMVKYGVATRAAEWAGYSPASARVTGPRLLRNAAVRAAVDARVAEAQRRAEISVDEVIIELARMVKLDPAELYDDKNQLLPVREMPLEARVCVLAVETEELWDGEGRQKKRTGDVRKVKLHDKIAAADKILRRLGGYAPEKHELVGGLAERLRKARERLAERGDDDGDDE